MKLVFAGYRRMTAQCLYQCGVRLVKCEYLMYLCLCAQTAHNDNSTKNCCRCRFTYTNQSDAVNKYLYVEKYVAGISSHNRTHSMTFEDLQ